MIPELRFKRQEGWGSEVAVELGGGGSPSVVARILNWSPRTHTMYNSPNLEAGGTSEYDGISPPSCSVVQLTKKGRLPSVNLT